MAEVFFKKAKQVSNSLTVQLNGSNSVSFDGSSAKSINITPSSIGAASSNHTHTWSQIQSKPAVLTPNNILTSLSAATDNSNVLGAKLVADLLNQSTLQLLDITDFNAIPDGLWMFDKTSDITNSPPKVWNGVVFQHTCYVKGASVDYAIKYQVLIQSNGEFTWTRICWYNNWQKWFLINQPHMDLNATNNTIQNAMLINTDGSDALFMRPGIIATEDASTILNCPIGSGPFYAFRKVYVVNTKVMVELHECYPRYGRIWSNCYDMNPQAWMNGGQWKPAQLYYHNANYRDFQVSTARGPHSYTDTISDLPSDAVITGIWTKLDVSLPIIVTYANIDTASKVATLTVWSLNEDGMAPSTIKCSLCYGYSYFN